MGCDNLPPGSGASAPKRNVPWHQKVHWKAEDFFDDPQVVALCKAIENNDLKEMKRLIDAGANVNAKGKGNMTPLLWAFFDDKPARLLLLLEHGADPNVIFTSNFGVKLDIYAGTSVTHMASGTRFDKYFDYVFDHGGDPNLVSNTPLGTKYTPIFEVLSGAASDKKRKVGRLIELGADLNHVTGSERTPAETAVIYGHFDIALQLLKSGADYRIYQPNSNRQLVHTVLSKEDRIEKLSPQQRSDYKELLRWLEDHGVSLEDARADLKRWTAPMTPDEYADMMAREVAARKANGNQQQKPAANSQRADADKARQ
jgi:ankyrin repeat protein